MSLTSRSLADALVRVAAEMEKSVDTFNALDAKIGDGDLGVTLILCARELIKITNDLPDDVGMALMRCTQAITKVSGSSFATILASGLMGAAKKAHGQTAVLWGDVSVLLGAAVEAMLVRGKCALGDKTVIDGVEAARKATVGLEDPESILEATIRAVDKTIEDMRFKASRVGRARIWAQKSAGLDDPGMIAFLSMLKGLREGRSSEKM